MTTFADHYQSIFGVPLDLLTLCPLPLAEAQHENSAAAMKD